MNFYLTDLKTISCGAIKTPVTLKLSSSHGVLKIIDRRGERSTYYTTASNITPRHRREIAYSHTFVELSRRSKIIDRRSRDERSIRSQVTPRHRRDIAYTCTYIRDRKPTCTKQTPPLDVLIRAPYGRHNLAK